MTGVGLGITVGLSLRRAIGPTAATIAATAVCAAGKMLDDEAMRVSRLLHAGDLHSARQRVRTLVGRNTEHLDEHEISRAVIESVAENCVDAITASLFWGTIGGAPAVLAHRAVNTLDAMVGHRDDRYRPVRMGQRPPRRRREPPARAAHRDLRRGRAPAARRRDLAGRPPRRTSPPVAERWCHRGRLRRRARCTTRRRQPVRQRHRGPRDARQRPSTDARRHRGRDPVAATRDGGVRIHSPRGRGRWSGHVEAPDESSRMRSMTAMLATASCGGMGTSEPLRMAAAKASHWAV